MSKKRIVLLHATPVAMAPIKKAFDAGWPEAEIVNLLDDGLSIDRAKEATLAWSMIERFVNFGKYGFAMGADAILVTCSAFGPAIEQLAREVPVPVLKPNEAMFRAAIAQGQNIGMLATFGPSVATMTDEFYQFRKETGKEASLNTVLVAEALDALKQGNVDSHNSLVAAHAADLKNCDAIMLAHFSTSEAAKAVSEKVDIPVLSAPAAAVGMLKRQLA